MAGFTEGFSDTSGFRNHIGAVISKVLVARQMAEKERAHAEAIAETQDTSLAEAGIERGYFFKKALGFEFGGQFYDEKKAQVKNIIDKRKLLKDPRGLTEDLKKTLKNKFKQRIGGDKTLKFRGQFNYTIDKPLDTLVPTTLEKTAEAASGKKTGDKISREDLLSTITGLTQSLAQTAQSINKNIGDNSTIASAIATSQSNIVNEISHRTTGIEDKLDAIVAAINEQTSLGKEQVDNKEGTISERRSEKQLDLPFTDRLDNPETKGLDESLLKSAGDEQDLLNAIPDPWEGGPMDGEPKQNIYPDMEQGGVIEGPDSGYWFKAHGKERITPLDNNFTQGEPSAVDGITRRPPMFEKGSYEIGSSPRQDHVGRTAFTPLNIPNLNRGGSSTEKVPTSGYTQPMVDLMTYPVMLTGGSILSSTSELISRLSPDSAAIASDIQRLSKPVASLFGLPNSMVSSVVSKTQLQSSNERKRSVDGVEELISPKNTKKKGLMDRLFDWWKKITGQGGDPDPNSTVTTPIGDGSKGNQSQREVASIMYRELIRLGYSDIGAKMVIAEMGRENSLNINTINGTHMDGPNKAWGAVSWQNGREKILKEELKKMGIEPTEVGLAGSGDKGVIASVRAFDREMGNRGVGNKPKAVAHRELSDLLQKTNLTDSEKEEVRQLFKDVYFVYGASNGITRSREWLKNVNTMLQKIGVGPLSIQPSSNPNLLTTQLEKDSQSTGSQVIVASTNKSNSTATHALTSGVGIATAADMDTNAYYNPIGVVS
jgi:hypothetical protein